MSANPIHVIAPLRRPLAGRLAVPI